MRRRDPKRIFFPLIGSKAFPVMGSFGVVAFTSIVFAQTNGSLDVPAQIEPTINRDIAVEDLSLSTMPDMSRVIIESIATPEDSHPLIVTQPQGTRDLCASGVADWERRQAGVNCAGIIGQRRPVQRQARRDPLFTNRQGEAEETFDDLGLGKDVPSTVILQK